LGAGWGAVPRALLDRALALDRRLGRAPLAAVLWAAPAVPATTPEVLVRRRLGPATPAVGVSPTGGMAGGVPPPGAGGGGALPRSVAALLDRLDPGTLERLRTAGRLGPEPGRPVAAVGGFARDLLLGRVTAPPRDLDVAVEGDGRILARHLARVLGGRL